MVRQGHAQAPLPHQLTGVDADQAGAGHVHGRRQLGVGVGQGGLHQNPAHAPGGADNAYFHHVCPLFSFITR